MKGAGRSHFWTWLSLLQLLASGAEQEGTSRGARRQLPRGRGCGRPAEEAVGPGKATAGGSPGSCARGHVVLNKLEDASERWRGTPASRTREAVPGAHA